MITKMKKTTPKQKRDVIKRNCSVNRLTEEFLLSMQLSIWVVNGLQIAPAKAKSKKEKRETTKSISLKLMRLINFLVRLAIFLTNKTQIIHVSFLVINVNLGNSLRNNR